MSTPQEIKSRYIKKGRFHPIGVLHPQWKGGDLNKSASDRWYERNRSKVLQYSKGYYKDKKKLVHQEWRRNCLLKIGGGVLQCSNCHCDEYPLLEVNHINGTGGLKRDDTYRAGLSLWRGIVKGEIPLDNYNILCKACNIIHYIKMAFGVDRYEIKWKKNDPTEN